MMQVAVEDTHDNYVICRGYDPRIKKFFDYVEAVEAAEGVEGVEGKPGVPVAKPWSNRTAGAYTVGQIFPAVIPLTRIGQTPGVRDPGEDEENPLLGQPADLDEDLEILYTDEGIVVNWILLDTEDGFAYTCNAHELFLSIWWIKSQPIPAYGVFSIDNQWYEDNEYPVYTAGTDPNSVGAGIIGKPAGWWDVDNEKAQPMYERYFGWTWAINSGTDVEPGAAGIGYTAAEKPRWVLYDQVNGFTPQIGETWGPLPDAGACKVYKGLPGFRIVGPHDDQGRILVMREAINLTGYAIAVENWQNQRVITVHPYQNYHVHCNPGIGIGSVQTVIQAYDGTTLWPETIIPIALLSPTTAAGDEIGHPNIVTGNVISYAMMMDGYVHEGLSGGCLYYATGTVKMRAFTTSAPQGWAKMNGTDNSGENGGSAIDMRGKYPLANAAGGLDSGTFGTTGADYNSQEVEFIERLDNGT